DLLDDRQLAAALAHERAHLDQRHDLVIACAYGLARAFSRAGLFTQGLQETRRLVELLADDVAVRSTDRLALAEALLNLAGSPSPAAALGAGGASAARVRRLLAPARPLDRRRRAGTSLGVLGLLAAPMIAMATPAVAATQMNYCATHVTAASTVSHR
ncbi:MAG: M48 family metalloprotease, partial [Candidatus Dormibacteraeota bacterium]|nr:M48 family metalloprotease [Candidatus Dormibacteraeota bacterium]